MAAESALLIWKDHDNWKMLTSEGIYIIMVAEEYSRSAM